jgi:hypothetical protein
MVAEIHQLTLPYQRANHHCLVDKFNRRTYKCNLAALFWVIIRLNWMMTVRE